MLSLSALKSRSIGELRKLLKDATHARAQAVAGDNKKMSSVLADYQELISSVLDKKENLNETKDRSRKRPSDVRNLKRSAQ